MPATINQLFQESASRYAERPALSYNPDSGYCAITYAELAARVRQLASGLVALGLAPGDHVALISENRPEWVVADLAILGLGAINVPMFATLPAAQVEYILADSGAKLLIVSDDEQRQKALEVRNTLPEVRIIAMEGEAGPAHGVLALSEVMQRGREALLSEDEFRSCQQRATCDDLASIVYTSGTTGSPKGVLLTHGNFAANVEACQLAVRFSPEDVLLSVLPLNHCFERTAGYYLPLSCGSQIAYAQSLLRLRRNIHEVRPTYMIVVPRLLESFQEGIEDHAAKTGALQQRLFRWAMAAGRSRAESLNAHRPAARLSRWKWALADRLVLRRIRDAAGLDRMKAFVAGGAPLALDTGWFLYALGVPVLEGYGLTETAPVVSFNRPDNCQLGTVGEPLPGVEVRLSAEGEILCRGPNVMQGYHDKPEETSAVLDPKGWFHTGDVGELNAKGFLRITDRIKDLLVLTNGKKVAPQPIESRLKASPHISQVVLVGDRRPTIAALIVPAFDRIVGWAQQEGISLPDNRPGIVESECVAQLVRSEIDRLSTDLADFEKIRGFALVDREFTVESGELTPTLKVKRRVVADRFADVIEGLYGGD